MNAHKRHSLQLNAEPNAESTQAASGGTYNTAKSAAQKKFTFQGENEGAEIDHEVQSAGGGSNKGLKRFNSNLPGTKTSQTGQAYYPGQVGSTSPENDKNSKQSSQIASKEPIQSLSRGPASSAQQVTTASQKKMFGGVRSGLRTPNTTATSKNENLGRKSPNLGYTTRLTGRQSPNTSYATSGRTLQKHGSSSNVVGASSKIDGSSRRTGKVAFGASSNTNSTFNKSRYSQPADMTASRTNTKGSSPQHDFIGQGKDGNKLNPKLAPAAAMSSRKSTGNLPVQGLSGMRSGNYDKYAAANKGSRTSLQQQPVKSAGGARKQRSPRQVTSALSSNKSNMENHELDDYDEGTDEFAGYSGATSPPKLSGKTSPQITVKKGASPTTTASSSSKKSSQQRQREKNIKEIKMYYWTKVDQGNQNEVFKILSYAKQQFNKDNELFEIVNCTNSDGFTPLHLAASEGHAPLIEILIKFKGQVDARTNNFRTPLHIACIRGNLTVVQALVHYNADINAKDIDGNTPCHFASEYGHRYCLKFLLTRNPYLFANNNKDLSAIDVAINNEILAEFQEFVAQSKDMPKEKKKEAPLVHKEKRADAQKQVSDTQSNKSAASLGNVSRLTGRSSGALSNNTRIRNQVSKVQQQMTAHKDEPSSAKVTQITIGEYRNGVKKQQSPKSPTQTKDRNEEKKQQEITKVHDQQRQASSTPHIQEVDDNYKSTYGQDNFLPLKKLGSGSFGDVYLVRDKNSGKLYAMKTLSKRKILGQNLVRYAKTERDVLSYMRHPFIVNLNFAFQTKTKLFLILEFCPGGDLGKVIAHERRFQEDRARLYIAEILLALQELHNRDIIYRDLKPDNVVLDDDGHALLTDFGLSKEGVLEVNKGAKSFCGSIAYLAPEMLRRVGHGKSVDWYLLGVLLYEMLVGSPPYFSGNKEELFHNIINGPLKLPRSISTEAKNLMVSLLNRNPTKRLGAGPEGAQEIIKHPFFDKISWDDVIHKRTNPPKPRLRSEQFDQQYPYSEFSKAQIQEIFDDEKELNKEHEVDANGKTNAGTRNVDGWSFIQMTESHIEIQKDLEERDQQNTAGGMAPEATANKSPKGGQYSLAGNAQLQNM